MQLHEMNRGRTVTIGDLIINARDLIEPESRPPGGNPEYERGITELIRITAGLPEEGSDLVTDALGITPHGPSEIGELPADRVPQLTVDIAVSNDAMWSGRDVDSVVSALRMLAENMADYEAFPADAASGPVIDAAGNRLGEWHLTPAGED